MYYIIEDLDKNFVNDKSSDYGTEELNRLTYKIIGACMEVHNCLGKGFSESVYKDCISIELENTNVPFTKEQKFEIIYKGVKIAHHYYADYVVANQIVLEVKTHSTLLDEHVKQVLNYLAVSKCKVGLLINFGEDSLKYRRIILTK